MDFFLHGILIVFFGSLIVLFFPNILKRIFSLIFSLSGSILIIFGLLNSIGFDSKKELKLPLLDIQIIVDELSIFFIIITAIIYLIIELYIVISKRRIAIYNLLLSFLFIVIALITVLQNSIVFLAFWELLSILSFLMIVNSNTVYGRKTGITYLIAAHISLIFLSIAFAILISETGSYNFNDYITFFSSSSPLSFLVLLLFFAGFGIKAKFIPFHSYFTSIYPYIDLSTIAVLSVCIFNTALYGILRIVSFIKTPPIILCYSLLFLSICSAIYGITYASISKNVKNIVGYSSVENAGIIGIAISIGMIGLSIDNRYLSFLGFSGALLHIINHSFFKTAISLSMANIEKKISLKNINNLGGLNKIFPFTTKLAIFSIVAIACLPPLNGFISEFIIYSGLLEGVRNSKGFSIIGLIFTIALLSLVGGIAIICFARFFATIFLGEFRGNRENLNNIKENIFSSFPIVLLTIPIIAIGLFPMPLFKLIANVVNIYIGGGANVFVLKFTPTLEKVAFINQIFFAIFVPLIILRTLIIKKNGIEKYKTWDCGFQKGTAKIQYNASSFSEPFSTIIEPFMPITTKKSDLDKTFYNSGFYKKYLKDFFYLVVIKPISFVVEKILGLLSWVQNGNTQIYLLFSLIFLIIMIIFAIGVK